MATKITAADLRVGNYVNWENTLCTVIQINDDGWVIVKDSSGDFHSFDIEISAPILLTEKIALKLGFKSRNYDAWLTLGVNDYTFYFNHSIKSLQVEYLGCVAYYSLRNNYVHTLQNLVKFLTNTELTIKEDNQ